MKYYLIHFGMNDFHNSTCIFRQCLDDKCGKKERSIYFGIDDYRNSAYIFDKNISFCVSDSISHLDYLPNALGSNSKKFV